MHDIHIETEVLTVPLQFAMTATRVAAVLSGIQQGQPIDERGRRALRAASKLLKFAVLGGTVLLDKSMAGYSAEALSAYYLIRDSEPSTEVKKGDAELVIRMKKIAEELLAIANDQRAKSKRDTLDLQRFFKDLANTSLGESTSSVEESFRID